MLDVIFGTVYFFVLISYSGLLTAVSLSVIPLYLAMIYIVAPIIKRQLRIAAEANAAASSLMVESLTGIQTVKAQHAETTLRWRWQQRYARFISSNFRTALIGATSGSIGSFFNEIGGLAVLVGGCLFGFGRSAHYWSVDCLPHHKRQCCWPIIRLAGTLANNSVLQISIERLADVVDAQTEQPEDLHPIALPPIQEKLNLRMLVSALTLIRPQL